ncbi:MAG: transposase, partial [Candidatus Thermoplasmatota archaeon]|nr:transposase [Candidatus Thermoplasmatota archaeon]
GWLDETKEMNFRKVGQPYIYPDSMIEFLGMLRSKGFDYRALQGMVRALSKKLGPFPVISFSQIRRRITKLCLSFKATSDNLIVGCDSSGIKVSNRGEWMREKWAVRRGWIKVVIMGDAKGNIVDIRIGNEDLDERAASRGMIPAVPVAAQRALCAIEDEARPIHVDIGMLEIKQAEHHVLDPSHDSSRFSPMISRTR